MQSEGVKRNVLVHYWCDFTSASIDFTISQATLIQQLPDARFVYTCIPTKKGDLREQAILLKQFKDRFPEGTFHICHFSRVSTDSPRYVIFEYRKQYFLGPASGFMHLAFEDSTTPYYILPPVAQDQEVLEKVYLQAIRSIVEAPNPEISTLFKLKEQVPRPHWIQPILKGNKLRLVCLYVDPVGNCYFNINQEEFERYRANRRVTLKTQIFEIHGIYSDFNDLPEGKVLAMFGNSGLLQIVQNNGNCSRNAGIYVDQAIIVEFYD